MSTRNKKLEKKQHLKRNQLFRYNLINLVIKPMKVVLNKSKISDHKVQTEFSKANHNLPTMLTFSLAREIKESQMSTSAPILSANFSH